MQVFSQPVFEIVEAGLTSRGSLLSRQAPVMRGVVRSLYVVVVTLVAACLPFFADLMGLIGECLPCAFIILETSCWLCHSNHDAVYACHIRMWSMPQQS
jgi:hypothetical protein